MAASPIMRGQRSAMSRREALILQCLINHPWLLHDHLEEVAALEMAHPEAHKLRAGIIAAFANDHHHSPDAGRAGREDARPISKRADFRRFFKGLSGRSRPARCGARKAGAAREDVLSTWHQLVVLHRQWHSLLREMKDAELALGEEPSEANLAWLRDVKARMAEADGTEALIEGFGELSGRFQRSV